ncbi:MAG: glycosyltransferase family 2 protein [Deltaproteobacteria bacterium]|nr:MAG: glycosyltransferase family 2 protein [Deltaproteobacteria bacterium]
MVTSLEQSSLSPYQVTVSIVTFNDVGTIAPTLEALLSQTGFVLGKNLNVIVRDNASNDGSAAKVEEGFGGQVTLFQHAENVGFSRAHNLSIREAMEGDADFVFVLNPDLRLAPDCLSMLCHALQFDSRAGSVCPKLLRADENLQPVEPHCFDSAGIVFTPNIRHFDRGSQELDQGQYDQEEYVFGGTGAALLLRREAICDAAFPPPVGQADSLELFDEAFFAYREDADLAWRLQRLGWKCRYVPKAVGYHQRHVRPGKRSEVNPILNQLGVQNRFFLQINNATLGSNLHGLGAATLRNLLVLGAVCTVERSSLPALKNVLRQLPKALAKRRWIQRKARVSSTSLAHWFAKEPVSEAALSSASLASTDAVTSVQAVIINYNSGDRVLRCLEHLAPSLERYRGELDVHVRVVDNNSHDGSAKKAESKFGTHPNITFEHVAENLGFSGGVNRGAFARDADVYLILNPDILVDVETIEAMAHAMSQHPDIAALSPILYGTDGNPQYGFTARRFPTLGSTLAEAYFLHRLWPSNPWTATYLLEDEPCLRAYMHQQGRGDGEPQENLELPFVAPQPAGACLMLRGSVFRELGGFDESFWPAWFEDVDFAKRCVEAGYVCAILGSASAQHEGGYSVSKLPAGRFVEIWYENMRLYWEKHGSPSERTLLRLGLSPALLLRSGVSLVRAMAASPRTENGAASWKESTTLLRLAMKSFF